MVVEDNQRLCIAINSSSTAQAHSSTRAEVTRVGHDIKTCNLTLQSLVNRLEGETLHIVHLEVLDSTGILTGRYLQACGGRKFLAGYGNLRHGLGVINQSYLKHTFATSYLLAKLLVADIGNLQRIVRILDVHGEVTIHISDSLTDNTVVLIYLLDVGTDNDINIIRNGT